MLRNAEAAPPPPFPGNPFPSMARLSRQTAVEWAFVACLTAGCEALSVLPYHWTGEVSRATAERLRSDFNGQVQPLGQAFDAGLPTPAKVIPAPADRAGIALAAGAVTKAHHFPGWMSCGARVDGALRAALVPLAAQPPDSTRAGRSSGG